MSTEGEGVVVGNGDAPDTGAKSLLGSVAASTQSEPQSQKHSSSSSEKQGSISDKPVVAETWWKGWIKEDGSLDKGRLAHLPTEYQSDKAIFDRFNKADDFFKTFVHAQKLAREKGLTPLREGASESERAEHIAKLAKINGVPDKPEGYGIKKPDSLRDDLWDDGVMGEMAKVFHKHALAPDAAKDLIETWGKLNTDRLAQSEEAMAKAQESEWKEKEAMLRNTWGPFLPERLKEAVAGLKWLGLDPSDPSIANNPALIIAAQKVSTKISEAKYVDGNSSHTPTVSAEAELKAMATDPSHKYYKAMHEPNRNPSLTEEAIQYRRKLTQQLAKELESRR
jgi:hypothetical protein